MCTLSCDGRDTWARGTYSTIQRHYDSVLRTRIPINAALVKAYATYRLFWFLRCVSRLTVPMTVPSRPARSRSSQALTALPRTRRSENKTPANVRSETVVSQALGCGAGRAGDARGAAARRSEAAAVKSS